MASVVQHRSWFISRWESLPLLPALRLQNKVAADRMADVVIRCRVPDGIGVVSPRRLAVVGPLAAGPQEEVGVILKIGVASTAELPAEAERAAVGKLVCDSHAKVSTLMGTKIKSPEQLAERLANA